MQSEGVCAREKGQRRSVQRAEKESRKPHAFWKMVYGKIFRKPFFSIYKAIFRSNYRPFLLTLILQRPKRLKMLKTFYEKHFTSKQTEPKFDYVYHSFFEIVP